MGVSTTICCSSRPLPTLPIASTSHSHHSSKQLNQTSWQRKEKEGGSSWRKQGFVGMTCMTMMMMGSQFPLLSNEISATAAAEEDISVIDESKKNVVRWSDKRGCPPWQVNSLEIIVPENLPRPSANRKSQTINLGSRRTNPTTTVRVTVRGGGNCFSM